MPISTRKESNIKPRTNNLIRSELLYTEIKGKMLECQEEIKKGNCTCCIFSKESGEYISLVPGEWEDILKAGASHQFEIVKNSLPYGGKEVICNLQGKNCNYQPLDCRLYPFFPKKMDLATKHIELYLGTKCPINHVILKKYYHSTIKLLLDLCTKYPDLIKWFESAAEDLKEYKPIYSNFNETTI